MKKPDIMTALRIYYENPEIGNAEIRELFDVKSTATLARMKRRVKEQMDREGIGAFGHGMVNTKVAYAVWGLDVEDLEKRREKLLNLGF